jgi:hypothetical protein
MRMHERLVNGVIVAVAAGFADPVEATDERTFYESPRSGYSDDRGDPSHSRIGNWASQRNGEHWDGCDREPCHYDRDGGRYDFHGYAFGGHRFDGDRGRSHGRWHHRDHGRFDRYDFHEPAWRSHWSPYGYRPNFYGLGGHYQSHYFGRSYPDFRGGYFYQTPVSPYAPRGGFHHGMTPFK